MKMVLGFVGSALDGARNCVGGCRIDRAFTREPSASRSRVDREARMAFEDEPFSSTS